MRVTLEAHTNVSNLLDFIGGIAGACTAKTGVRDGERALRCIREGHHSVLEHVSFTWRIEGISRACSHQLVRHRIASYTQESQRYVKVDTDSYWYVRPDSFSSSVSFYDDMTMDSFFDVCARDAARNYNLALEKGIKPEDARYLLPNACKTNIWVTMNLREFLQFCKLRIAKHAQWEIRELASGMASVAISAFPELAEIIEEVVS